MSSVLHRGQSKVKVCTYCWRTALKAVTCWKESCLRYKNMRTWSVRLS